MPDAPAARRFDWRLIVRYLRPYRWRVVLLVLILAATISVQIATPLVAGRFIDRATGGAATSALVVIALLTIGLAFLGQGLAVAETWVAERVAWGATNTLREDLTAHILRLDAAFHHAHTPGELIERVDGDIGSLARLFSRFAVQIVGNAVLILGVLAVLIAVDWRIGLGLTALVAVAFAVILWLRASSTPLSIAERQVAAEVYGFLGEHLAGRENIAGSGARGFVRRRWVEITRRWLAARTRAGMRGYAMVATGDLMFGLGTAFALAVGALLYRDGTLTIGAVFLVYRLTDMLREPMYRIRDEVQDLQQAAAGLGRVGALLAVRSRLTDGPVHDLPPGLLGVTFEDVRYGYHPDTTVLRDISIDLPAGRVLGIVGRTGSGKSTLSRLVSRIHDPDAGAVRLGGVDLRTVRVDAVRARVGVVTQDARLFDASLRDNLTVFDDQVPDDRLVATVAAVGLADWLAGLPNGLDSVLGTGGAGLSVGQTQALACARVMLRDPDVVVLDEPSSRLDPATERLIHLAIARLLEGRTGIVIAHRLRTIELADDVLVLEDGEVVEHGARLALGADPTSRYSALLRHAGEEVLA